MLWAICHVRSFHALLLSILNHTTMAYCGRVLQKKKKCTPIPNLNQNKIVKLNKLSFSHINKPDEADQELHLTATTSNPNPEHLRVFFVMRLLTVLSVFLIGSPSQKKKMVKSIRNFLSQLKIAFYTFFYKWAFSKKYM